MIIFCACIIYITVAEFCEKLKVVFSDFPIMKNFVALWFWFSSFPIKLICCGSFNLVYLLKSIAIKLKFSLKWIKSNELPVV